MTETLDELITPLVYAEATALIAQHRGGGTGRGSRLRVGGRGGRPIGAMLGVDQVIATRLTVEDGRYTGDIEFYAYADNKALALIHLAAEQGYDLNDCYAYSDSGTDLPMLEAVGHPTLSIRTGRCAVLPWPATGRCSPSPSPCISHPLAGRGEQPSGGGRRPRRRGRHRRDRLVRHPTSRFAGLLGLAVSREVLGDAPVLKAIGDDPAPTTSASSVKIRSVDAVRSPSRSTAILLLAVLALAAAGGGWLWYDRRSASSIDVPDGTVAGVFSGYSVGADDEIPLRPGSPSL